MNRVHLDRMPKARLIAMIHEAQSLADSHAATAEQWRGIVSDLIRTSPRKRLPAVVTVERTRDDAQHLLERLPRDPHAAQHRADLAAALDLQPCGTIGGYRQHHHRGERACDACRAANAKYDRGRKKVA